MGKFKKLFICGVHGVGKSTFLENSIELESYVKYECSQLIKKYSGLEFKEKQIDNINKNQNILLNAVDFYVKEEFVIFDGHLVLFNKDKDMQVVESEILKNLHIEKIIYLKAPAELILERIAKRDNNRWLTVKFIDTAQKLEELKVKEYSHTLNIGYQIYEWCATSNSWNLEEVN